MNAKIHSLALGALAALSATHALAGEGFQVRYNIAGSLGGEMFAPPDSVGWAVGAAHTFLDITKVTGGDGNKLTKPIAGGTLPLPAPTPAALYPTYGANSAEVEGTGTLRITNLAVGYITTDSYAGGRLAAGLSVAYGVKTQNIGLTASTPALQWAPVVPAATQAAVGAKFATGYQGQLAAQSAAATGRVSGFGDVEAQAGWLYTTGRLRVLAGASLIVPTGKYDANPAPDIGAGNFYTVRPTVQVAYLITPDVAVAGKATIGHNTRNKDNDLRSGDWLGLEGAAAYKTPVGVIGVHSVYVQQYQDDSNNPWGASRFRELNVGAFFTTKVPVVDAVVTVQYMTTTDSRNAKAGNFSQVRLLKLF